MNRQTKIKSSLIKRAQVVDKVRSFFKTRGFLEVDTPIRNKDLAVEAHVEPIEAEGWYLQTSPEICMKRLLAAGYDKIFQIAKCFRKNECGARHLPEMNLLEWYIANEPYTQLMTDCEDLLRFVAGGNTLVYQGHSINLADPWQRLTLAQAFDKYADTPLSKAIAVGLFEEILTDQVEPQLGFNQPVFIYNYPASMASLARKCANDPNVAERFELYVAGIEIANGFGELTDTAEQRARFAAEQARQADLDHKVMPMPQRFLDDLAHMPPSSGIALGLDRLIMLFCDAKTIDAVTAFAPQDFD